MPGFGRSVPHSSGSSAQVLARCRSQQSADAHGSSSVASLHITVTAGNSLTLRRRTLRETLDDFKGDSDAPPALRCLSEFPAVSVGNVNFNDDDVNHSHHIEKMVGIENEAGTCIVGGCTTAPPTPRETQKCISSSTSGIEELGHRLCHGNAESSLSSSADASGVDNTNGDTHILQDTKDVGLLEIPLLLSTAACHPWHSYSGPFKAHGSQGKFWGGDLSCCVSTEVVRKSGSDGPRPAVNAFGSLGRGKKSNTVQESRENSASGKGSNEKGVAAVHVCPDSKHFFTGLRMLKPVFFAASYPRGDVRKRFGNITREVPRADKNGGVAKLSEGTRNFSSEINKMKLPSTMEMHHVCIRNHGSESCFSLSSPRRQSTSSMQYSTNFHTSRLPFLRTSQAQARQQQMSHSRVYSLSYASSDKAPCSPTASGTLRPRPSDSLERFHSHRLVQQTHLCHLPAFTSCGASWEGVEHGMGLVAAWHGSRLCDNNSISSLLLTRTTSNIDTLPTCCDAPLDSFMESSTFTVSSTFTPYA